MLENYRGSWGAELPIHGRDSAMVTWGTVDIFFGSPKKNAEIPRPGFDLGKALLCSVSCAHETPGRGPLFLKEKGAPFAAANVGPLFSQLNTVTYGWGVYVHSLKANDTSFSFWENARTTRGKRLAEPNDAQFAHANAQGGGAPHPSVLARNHAADILEHLD